jgi:hypothetical protein
MDAGVAFPKYQFRALPLRIARYESRVLRPIQFYLFRPKVYRPFVIGKQVRLTVNLDVCYVPAAIHFSRWKLA